MSQETKDENGKKRKKLFIIVCVLIIVIFSGIMLFFNLKKDEIEKRNVVVNPKNAEEIAEQMINEDYVEAGYYTVSMDTNWHFDKGDAVSDNARVNIPRGGYLEKIALDQPLSKGTYDCIIVYHLVNEEQETISTLRVSFTITVES